MRQLVAHATGARRPGAPTWTKRSAAVEAQRGGYIVPRLLPSVLDLDVPTLFSGERFSGSPPVRRPADPRTVDVIATYAHLDPALNGFALPTALAGARLLATAGPIPGDVVLCGSAIDEATRIRVTAALLAAKFAPNGAGAARRH